MTVCLFHENPTYLNSASLTAKRGFEYAQFGVFLVNKADVAVSVFGVFVAQSKIENIFFLLTRSFRDFPLSVS